MDVFVTQDGPSEQMITYCEFIETFNAISSDYRAHSANDEVVIVSNYSGYLAASLRANSLAWDFKESSFNSEELFLMAKLAGNMPEFRGKLEEARVRTYRDFFKAFNEVSRGFHACPSNRGGAAIVDAEGNLMANLGPKSRNWRFDVSAWSYDEFALMEQLAAVPPELRGGINDD